MPTRGDGGRGRGGQGGRGRGGPRRPLPGWPRDAEALGRFLEGMDGAPYPAYKDLTGSDWELEPFLLVVDHVQGDPFAAPSRIHVDVPPSASGLGPVAGEGPVARRAAADFLHRALRRALGRGARRVAGSGKSGLLEVAPLGPEILERSGVSLAPDGRLRVRLTVGLPAQGRRILGRAAAGLLADTLPDVLDDTLRGRAIDRDGLRRHIEAAEDQVALRGLLAERGLVAFVADGSVLPRASGVVSAPLGDAVPFEAPAPLAVTLDAPHAGPLRGLGVPAGVTLIVGGGYHGKSTLLDALALGVYDHRPGDGREQVVTVANAACVRAEDGRSVRSVDLSPFIANLPLGRDTRAFETDDASGSTSQAAAIVESLEAGAEVLLIDEDTAATNFMIRDARMRALVPDDEEPITPFLDRVRQLHTELGVSSVLVVGGAGDYLDVADTVVRMDAYRARDVTAEAQAVAERLARRGGAPTAPGPWPALCPRRVDPAGLDPSRGRRAERVRSSGVRALEFGEELIDLSLVAQLVDPAQAKLLGDALLAMSRGLADGSRTVPEVLDAWEAQLGQHGVDGIAQAFGDRAAARRLEVAAALNRLRSLRVRSGEAAQRAPGRHLRGD